MSEHDLLILLTQGDKEAFTILYKKYWGRVYDFCRLYLTSRDESEDIMQEVFIKIWEVRTFIRPEENFEGFLFMVTRNIIFNKNRRKVNENYYKLSVMAAFEESFSIEEEIENHNLTEYIDQLIAELPPLRQRIFNMHRKEGWTYKEIAEELNISEKAVEHQLAKALKYLKKNFIWMLPLLITMSRP